MCLARDIAQEVSKLTKDSLNINTRILCGGGAGGQGLGRGRCWLRYRRRRGELEGGRPRSCRHLQAQKRNTACHTITLAAWSPWFCRENSTPTLLQSSLGGSIPTLRQAGDRANLWIMRSTDCTAQTRQAPQPSGVLSELSAVACQGYTKRGTRCRNKAKIGGLCLIHALSGILRAQEPQPTCQAYTKKARGPQCTCPARLGSKCWRHAVSKTHPLPLARTSPRKSPECDINSIPHRTGRSKPADLDVKIERQHSSFEVSGVKGSSEDRPPAFHPRASWLSIWTLTTKSSASPLCCAKGCMKTSTDGAHVWRWDEALGKFNKKVCYIVPTCRPHNSKIFEYPRGYFHTKPGIWVMSMLPHACYHDFHIDH